MIIVVSDYTKSGFSYEDAKKISEVLKEKLKELSGEDSLCFDFSNVKFFTTLFFNTAFTSLLTKMSLEEYEKKIQLVNLSKVGQTAYNHSLENAKRFVNTPREELDRREKIIAAILEEEQGE